MENDPQLSPVAPRPGDEIRTERLLAYREGYACGKMDGYDAGFAAAREMAIKAVDRSRISGLNKAMVYPLIQAIQPGEKK